MSNIVNSRNIKKHLRAKVEDWLSSIDDDNIKDAIKNNLIISGGSIVSLLNGDPIRDYDCYFRTKEACYEVANYYASKWNSVKDHYDKVEVLCGDEAIKKCHLISDDYVIRCFISSSGVAGEKPEEDDDLLDDEVVIDSDKQKKSKDKEKYRPIYFSSNAITLSNKIQLVVRFYGTVEELHKNFDYVHCTCAYDYCFDELMLPNRALEAILNKELVYVGSKYPLCSIFRSKKYLQRGYRINAGQYLKMVMQLNKLDLTNIDILRDQLLGVDSYYFGCLISSLQSHAEASEDEDDKEYNAVDNVVDDQYLMQIISEMFD